MNKIKVLLNLTRMGLGDTVQFGIVLKHLTRYRPHWVVDCVTEWSLKHAVESLCNTWMSEADASILKHYDVAINLSANEFFCTFPDRPSTRVATLLRGTFGIEQYDADLGRYEVWNIPIRQEEWFATFHQPEVVCHFASASYKLKKEIPQKDQSQIFFNGAVTCDLGFRKFNVGELATFIRGAKAFVGIDSGPGKVASSTDIPTLICWTGHHPIRYHDPAPNTTHLIPVDWPSLPPFDEPGGVDALSFFRANYRFRTYVPGELGIEARQWLKEVLGE